MRSEWSHILRRGGDWLGSGTQETGDGGVDGAMGLVVEAEEHGYLGASSSAGAGRSSSLYQ